MAETTPPTRMPNPMIEMKGKGLLAGGRFGSSSGWIAGSGCWKVNPAILRLRPEPGVLVDAEPWGEFAGCGAATKNCTAARPPGTGVPLASTIWMVTVCSPTANPVKAC